MEARDGGESAEMVTPKVLEWLERNGKKDNWMMHVHAVMIMARSSSYRLFSFSQPMILAMLSSV